jgi:hypothetical protein
VEAVFFPLDDEVNQPQSGLTPHVHQGLVLLGCLVPFASAAKHLETLLKVHVSPNGVRRLTEQAGKVLEQWQKHHAQPTSEGGPEEGRGERLAMATDGVLVPVLPNEWSEVKMTTIGEVSQMEEGQPHCEQLSYFARLANADTFGDLASFEMRRRGVDQAPAVAAVNDGAEWIQGFIHAHRADAVRILDCAHAAQYLSEIVTLVGQAGVTLSATWLSEQLRDLKEKGPGSVLAEVQRLQERVPTTEVSEQVAYLCKREGQMQYPQYLDEGWPIGSGMAESGNKLVVQARLKGAGMHWQRSQVNPMLALRTTICSDRWPQDWHVVRDHWREERSQRFETHRQQALEKGTLRLQQTFWRFPLPFLLACFPSPPPPPAAPKGRSEGQKRWGRRSFSPRAILDGRYVKGCVCKKMARTRLATLATLFFPLSHSFA